MKQLRHYFVFCLLIWVSTAISQSLPRLTLVNQGHSARINEILFTADGSQLISVSDDKTIHVWETSTGDLIRTLRPFSESGFSGRIYCATLSPDDRFLAIGGFFPDNEIRIIDLQQSPDVVILKGHKNVVSKLRFSADGSRLLSASNDQSVRIWNLTYSAGKVSGVPGPLFTGHTAPVYDIAWTLDNQRFVSASLDGTLRLWNAQSSGSPVVMKMHIDKVYSVAVSPDGNTIASGGNKGDVLIWDSQGSYRQRLPSVEQPVTGLAFTPEGRLMVTSERTQLVDVEAGVVTHRFPWPAGGGQVTASAVFNSKMTAIAGGFEGDIILFQNSDYEPVRIMKGKGRIPRKIELGGNLTVGIGYRGEKVSRYFDLSSVKFYWNKSEVQTRPAVANESGYQLQKLDDYTLSTGFSGSVKNEPRTDGRILSFAILSSNKIGVGSDYSFKIYDRQGKLLSELKGQNGEIWDLAPSADGRLVVAACGDQTISVWNMETGEKLVSLFVAENNEWIVWTPQGYYEASAGGEAFLGWQVDHRPDRISDFYPASTFQSTHHFPEVVKQTLRFGSFQKAKDYIGELNPQTIQKPQQGVVQSTPTAVPPAVDEAPKIEWITPQTFESESNGPEVLIRVKISSASDIALVRILVDGRTPDASRSVVSYGKDYVLEQRIKLMSKLTEVRIFVRNASAKALSEPRRINWRGGMNPDSGTLQLMDHNTRPNLHFIGVGISKFIESKYDLNYAEADASAISEIFSKPGEMYNQSFSQKLLDGQATRENIIRAIKDLKKNVTEKDVVVLFVASHGFIFENDFYILPHDARSGDLPGTSVRWDQLSDDLATLPCKVLLILDACHSGQLGANFSTKAVDNTEALRTMASDEYGVVIMSASTGAETALESDAWQHGAFSYSILEGLLQGKADVKKDGIIHLAELDLFTSERTIELTNGHQHPTTQKPSTIKRMPLIRTSK